jgi:hypothetical protein
MHDQNPLAGPDAPSPEKQFYSVGFVCSMLQQPPAFVEGLMRLAGVEFDHCVNGVGQIRGDHLQKMAKTLAEARAQVEHIEASN